MATVQQQKSDISSWSKVFPPEQRTKIQSHMFIKKLLIVAVSNLTYLRALFPENAYSVRSLEGLNLRILKEETCPKVAMLIKWLKGCFDALEKEYLRQMIVGIHGENSDPESVIESYNFRFFYQDGVAMTMNKNESEIQALMANTRSSTVLMLRTILILTSTLKPLPKDVKMVIKLHYYDEVTPPDYQPPGFVDCPYENFNYQKNTLNIEMGEVETPFNILKLRIKTVDMQLNLNQQELAELSKNGNGFVKDQEQIAVNYSEPTREEEKENSLGQQDEDEPLKIRCGCGDTETDGLMISCNICEYWQHAICFRIVDQDNAPKIHVCHLCVKLKDPTRQPTDPSLVSLSSLATQATCIWRRTLGLCMTLSRISINGLTSQFKIDKKVAEGLITRLKNDGFIKKKLSKNGYFVDKVQIETVGKPKYFELRNLREIKDVKHGEKEDNVNGEKTKDAMKILAEKTKAMSVKDTKTSVNVEKVNSMPQKRKRKLVDQNGQAFNVASSQDTTFYDGGNGSPTRRWKTSRTSPTLYV